MPKLHIKHPDGRRTVMDLEGEEWLIGRDASCEIPLDDASISRRHARLHRDPQGRFWVQDLQSKNGTSLNEKVITTAQVSSGDQIAVGNCTLRLTLPAEPSIVLSDTDTATTHATTSSWGPEQRVALAQKRLETLYELNERLTGLFKRDELLGELLDICIEHLRFERAGVAVWSGEPQQPPQWVLIKNTSDKEDTEIRLSRSIVDRALHHGERILITDTAGEDFDPTASMIASRIRSAMCVPMEYHGKVRGVIYGDRVTSAGGYAKEDIDYFAALGRLGAMGLANVHLVEEMQQRERIDMQFQLARQIQSKLFPAEPLRRDDLIVDALNDPGQRISGDYYDYFTRPDGLIAVVIADVAGKGLPASILMANLQAAVHVVLAEETDLVKVVDVLNKLVCQNARETKFITGIFGLLDPATRKLTFVNAGHPVPYLLHPNGDVAAADDTPSTSTGEIERCLPLGIEMDAEYHAASIALDSGPATLIFYTDGVSEAENPTGEQYTENRFVELLRTLTDQPPDELVTRIRRSIKQFARNHPQTDDITLVALRLP